MEFKGTKGKWEINSRASRNVRCNNSTIANCSQGQDGENELEEKANALLISKAPEMLEMLNHLHGRIDFSWDAWGSREGFEISNKIEQLIKEATELTIKK